MKLRTSILLLSLLGALPAYADQASIAIPEGSTAFKNAFGTTTSTFDDVLHYAVNPALKTLASNFGGTSCTAITTPTPNQWCVDIGSRTVKMYSPNGSGVYAWNTALVINSDGSLSPSNLVAGAVSSVAGRSGSVLLTSSDLTDATTLGRGLVGAANAAAAKALLAITASDVANLAPSAVTDTTNASNIGTGTLSNARLAVGAAVANLGFTPLNKAGDTMTGQLLGPSFDFNSSPSMVLGAGIETFVSRLRNSSNTGNSVYQQIFPNVSNADGFQSILDVPPGIASAVTHWPSRQLALGTTALCSMS
jgi:hypothetical protein